MMPTTPLSFFPAGTEVADIAAELARRPSHPPLVARGVYSDELRRRLNAIRPEAMFAEEAIVSPRDAMAVLAGLHLWNDDLAECHTIAEVFAHARDILDADGGVWANRTAHWLRSRGRWDPIAMVDWCEAAEVDEDS